MNALAGSVASTPAGRQILTRKLAPAKMNPTRKKNLHSACLQSQKVMKLNISSGWGAKTQPHNATLRRGRLLSASARMQWVPRKDERKTQQSKWCFFF
jgi:hypothetical protein